MGLEGVRHDLSLALVGQMAVQQIFNKVQHHIVQHQGVYHFAYPQLCLQHSGDEHHGTHGKGAGQYGSDGKNHGGQGGVDSHHRGHEGAQHDAALGTQVELVGGEHDAGGQTGEHNGDHGSQHVGQVLGADAAAALEGGADEQLTHSVGGLGQLLARARPVRRDEDQQSGYGQGNQDRRSAPDQTENNTSFFIHDRPS